jgi:HK97 family phage prohead protease
MALDMRPLYLRAQWSTAYINDLPDSAFLLITPGGTKTGGKTDGAHRFFPVYGSDGKLDDAHLANALARIPQAANLTADQRAAAMGDAKKLAAAHPTMTGPAGTYGGSAGSGRSKAPAPAEWAVMQYRTFEVEFRSDGDGRTLHGRAVPFGTVAAVPVLGRERFLAGAFARQISGGNVGAVKLHATHSQRSSDLPIGKTVQLVERQDGLYGAWRMYDTPRGEEALQLVRTGEITGLSVGFKPVDAPRKAADGVYEQHSAHLDHVALTNEPAYAGAQITAVRSVEHPIGGYRTDLLRARGLLDRVLSG